MKQTLIITALILALLLHTGCRRQNEEPFREPPVASELPLESEETVDPLEEARISAFEEETSSEPEETSAASESQPEPETSSQTEAASSRPVPESSSPPEPVPEPPSSQPPESSGPPATAAPATAQTGLDAAGIESELLRLINAERSSKGVEALGRVDAMQFAARIRAQESLVSLSHTRPDGTPYYTAFDEAGFPYAGKWHGENVATISMTGTSSDETAIARSFFQNWVGSEGHYQNMLSENFIQTGIGVSVVQDGDTVQVGAAQLFSSL